MTNARPKITGVFSPAQKQEITWNLPSEAVLGEGPIAIKALSSSGLDVKTEVVDGPGSIDNGNLRILGAGKIVLRSTQDGNRDYSPAPAIVRTIDVRLRPDIQIRPGGTVLREPETPTVPYGQSLVLTALPNDGVTGRIKTSHQRSNQNQPV